VISPTIGVGKGKTTEFLIKLADCRSYRTTVRDSSIGNLTVVATCTNFYVLYDSRFVFCNKALGDVYCKARSSPESIQKETQYLTENTASSLLEPKWLMCV
jgi:hypothetical protein